MCAHDWLYRGRPAMPRHLPTTTVFFFHNFLDGSSWDWRVTDFAKIVGAINIDRILIGSVSDYGIKARA